jgi:hypothetical protein
VDTIPAFAWRRRERIRRVLRLFEQEAERMLKKAVMAAILLDVGGGLLCAGQPVILEATNQPGRIRSQLSARTWRR